MAAVIKDRSSIEWIRVKDFCKTSLAEFRELNDGDLDTAETAKVRGKIEFAKEILALEERQEPLKVGDNTYIK